MGVGYFLVSCIRVYKGVRGKYRKVPGFKNITKVLVGGPSFRILLENLEKTKGPPP